MLPLVAGFWFRRPLTGLALAAVLTVAWNETFQHFGAVNQDLGLGLSFETVVRLAITATLQLPAWAFSFGLGMTGAWAYVRLRDRSGADFERRVRVARIAGVAGLILFAWLSAGYSGEAPVDLVAQFSRQAPLQALGFSAFLALTMVSFALGRRADESLPGQPATPAARRHQLRHLPLPHGHRLLSARVLPTCRTTARSGPSAVWTIAVFPAAVLYGYLSARFLEQPIRRWARQYGRRDEG